MLPDVDAWLPNTLIQGCADEADTKFPLETGGTFMGWWLSPDTAVVAAMIGPGPGALHERFRFQPDQQWQVEQIAAHYESSGRRETYLGDWHSHPGAPSGALSWTDRGVLRRVIATPEARCALPLMMILWGSSGTWQLTAWRAQTMPRVVLWDKLHLDPVQIRAF
ncbi:Mov34/MPN/PAD-1 family protein [Mesorhizobium australicum]|uniref:Mov34/MPN/PAD-1 family protein n=1 Tax=Mesorhizobium australicum TaxID=536018 RepID=UPI00333E0D8A